jgi:hypothetical protein
MSLWISPAKPGRYWQEHITVAGEAHGIGRRELKIKRLLD